MAPQKSKSHAKKETTFVEILKQDHDKVRDLFEQIEEDEAAENRGELFPKLQSELQEHLELEEKFFYPVLLQNDETRDKAMESVEEHNVAKMFLVEFKNVDLEDERWIPKLKVLQEIVNHHLQEEEKNVFKMAKQNLDKDQIQQITDQIKQQKSEIEKKAA